jgi:hypothetical protein
MHDRRANGGGTKFEERVRAKSALLRSSARKLNLTAMQEERLETILGEDLAGWDAPL